MIYNDTIVALATPSGAGAIAVIRLSGKEAIAIAEKHFKSVKSYFGNLDFKNFTDIENMSKNNLFDNVLVQAIEEVIDVK